MESKADLIIVGGGLAGFAAALTAAQAGIDSIVIEKQAETGGSSAMSGGCLAFAGTDVQAAAGIEDSSDLLFQDLREVGQFENDEAIVRSYADNQLVTFEWLRANGAEFSAMVEAASGQSVPRSHNVDPADLVRQLQSRALASGHVKVQVETRATKLIHDPSTKRVIGVEAVAKGEATNFVASRAVILTSGGFCRNPDLIHRFVPHYDEAIFIGGEGNEGDGLRMAWALGADFRDMPYIKGTFGKHPTDETNHHACLAVYKGAIAVNQNGKRYVDESLSYKLLGDACLRQPYSCTYQILDQAIMDSGDNRVRIMDFQRRHEEGLFVVADTLESLAEQLEIPSHVLVETVDRYNAGVDKREDPDFGRQHLVHNHGDLCRIEKAPFYAYPSAAVVFGTYCGLCVNDRMQVIDVYGQIIEGLFAAGEVVGGLHGAAYMTGTALGKAAIFGRIAAQSALEGRI